jgi:ADP-heptose:LPS heptosyltransferase
MALAALAPVLRAPGYSFYSLQHGPAGAEIESVREIRQIHETAVNTGEVADTAADIRNLDLVITVDTMTAHLAGALGKPVWTMLPFRADWRWMLDRDDSPWYPTMRLFRQSSPGDWSGAIERIAAELRAYRFFDCSGRTM